MLALADAVANKRGIDRGASPILLPFRSGGGGVLGLEKGRLYYTML